MNVRPTARALICAAVLVLSAGCSTQNEPEGPPSSPSSSSSASSSSADVLDQADSTADRAASTADQAKTTVEAPQEASDSLVATGKESELTVHAKPDGKVVETFENPTPTGVPLTFMVTKTEDDWVQVQLPVRPNGSTAWVAADDVTITTVTYALKASTADNTLELYREDELIETYPVATGTGGTPTPTGTFYLTELITPTNEGYGPFAYGISAFSEELTSFGGGPGQIGLHGTDEQDSIGRAVSNGCLRLSNPVITKLSALLPLGTPIEIT